MTVMMERGELETPSVVIDLDRLERNITRMQTRCTESGLMLRVHVTAHRIPEIARMQLDAGAVGIACQTVHEAEIFARAGFNNILIPTNVVDPATTARLSDLAIFNRLTVSADHSSVIAGLADAAGINEINIRVLVELRTDQDRGGAGPDEVAALAERIEQEENLHFAGLMLFPASPANHPTLQAALDRLNKAGIGVDVVVGGGTGLIQQAHELPEVTECCAGSYVLNDLRCVQQGWAEPDDCALVVAAAVVSRPDAARAIVNAGSRVLTARGSSGGYGLIVEYPDARLYRLDAEHAYVDLSACEEMPVIGERVHILPVDAGGVIHLQSQVYGLRGDQVETVWAVPARGSAGSGDLP